MSAAVESINHHHQIEKDFFKFFTTTEGIDMMPYIYNENSNLYNELTSKCYDYYPFKDEVELIKNNEINFKTILNNVENIIEIGPGSGNTILNKTLPLINCSENIKNYYAIDFCKDYLESVCSVIQSHLPKINVKPIQADLLDGLKFNINIAPNTKTAYVILGGTPGNFTDNERSFMLTKIHNSINKDDLLIATFDTNPDQNSILRAYDHNYNYEFFKAGIEFYAKINASFNRQKHKLDVKCSFNHELHAIEMYAVASEDFSFYFPGYGDILIHKGQKLKGIKSKKFNRTELIELFDKNSFQIEKFLNNSNKMNIVVARKR